MLRNSPDSIRPASLGGRPKRNQAPYALLGLPEFTILSLFGEPLVSKPAGENRVHLYEFGDGDVISVEFSGKISTRVDCISERRAEYRARPAKPVQVLFRSLDKNITESGCLANISPSHLAIDGEAVHLFEVGERVRVCMLLRLTRITLVARVKRRDNGRRYVLEAEGGMTHSRQVIREYINRELAIVSLGLPDIRRPDEQIIHSDLCGECKSAACEGQPRENHPLYRKRPGDARDTEKTQRR